MKEDVWVKNPLTLEEKLQVTRIFGHDFNNESFKLKFNASAFKNLLERQIKGLLQFDIEKAYPYANVFYYYSKHLELIGWAVSNLIQVDKLCLEITKGGEINKMLETIKFVLGENKTDYEQKTKQRFHTNTELLYTALHNIVKNAVSQVKNLEEGRVLITMDLFEGRIPNLVFKSEETPQEGEFIKFNVNDNGPGFSDEYALIDYLKLDVGTREEGGFGLYYVSLVAKVFGAHISIDSRKDNTNVTLYCPVIR